MCERLRPLRTKFALIFDWIEGERVERAILELSQFRFDRLRVKLESAFLFEEMCVEENSCMPVLDWLLSFNEEQ